MFTTGVKRCSSTELCPLRSVVDLALWFFFFSVSSALKHLWGFLFICGLIFWLLYSGPGLRPVNDIWLLGMPYCIYMYQTSALSPHKYSNMFHEVPGDRSLRQLTTHAGKYSSAAEQWEFYDSMIFKYCLSAPPLFMWMNVSCHIHHGSRETKTKIQREGESADRDLTKGRWKGMERKREIDGAIAREESWKEGLEGH